MEFIKKIFSFNVEDDSVIGLCKFESNSICDTVQNESKKIQIKNITLSELLKKQF